MMERQRFGKITETQHEIMLSFMGDHDDLARGKLGGKLTADVRDRLWEEMTVLLNGKGNGPVKSVNKWRKCWIDWKCSTKAKASRIQRRRKFLASHCGDNPRTQAEVLTHYEERLLQLIGFHHLPTIDYSSASSQKRIAEMQEMMESSSTSIQQDKSIEIRPVFYKEPEIRIKEEVGDYTSICEQFSVDHSQNDHNLVNRNDDQHFTNNTEAEMSSGVWHSQIPHLQYEEMMSEMQTKGGNGKKSALDRIASAQERRALAEERKASALEGILDVFADYFKRHSEQEFTILPK